MQTDREIFIDIETIPDQRDGALAEYVAAVTAPAQYKKPESIQKWLDENSMSVGEQNWLKTSFDGGRGEIISIAWVVGDGVVGCVSRDITGKRKRNCREAAMLRQFFRRLEKQCGYALGGNRKWVGHNVQFDLRFLWQRCVALGVPGGIYVPWGKRHGSSQVYDTMEAWAGWREYIKLQKLAEILGVGDKLDDIDASQVWPMAQRGEINKITKYNRKDVVLTRRIYWKMIQRAALRADRKPRVSDYD